MQQLSVRKSSSLHVDTEELQRGSAVRESIPKIEKNFKIHETATLPERRPKALPALLSARSSAECADDTSL